MRDEVVPGESRKPAGISPIMGCLVSVTLGAAAVACLVLILQLTLRGDITMGSGSPNETRLWLIREDGNEGLGLSRTRTSSSAEAQAECTQTSVRFYLWRSDRNYPPITTCSCLAAGGELQTDGACPP